MQGVILAAGKGTRLHPITVTRSKAMAPVLEHPIIARVMDTLTANGIRDFVLIVSEDDQEIRNYFRQRETELNVRFVVQKERLGMAKALSLAAPYLHDNFILSACDNLTSTEHVAALIETHERQNEHATLSLMEVARERIRSTGIVDIEDGRIRRIVEKPTPEEAPSNISSLPLYVFSQALLDYLPKVKSSARGEYELQDAIQMLIDEQGPLGGVYTPSRLQLTNPADLLVLNKHYLAHGNGSLQIQPTYMGENTKLHTPLRIDEEVIIHNNCSIGPNVYLERGCQIGDGATIRDSVILRSANVSGGSLIEDAVVA